MDAVPSPPGRRPLTTRGRAWARALAGWLARRRVSPNAISVASIGFAALAGGGFLAWPQSGGWGRPALLTAVAGAIQLRLLCNMLDGMVAVEGGLRSPTGDLYNEVPDRISDSIILVALGYGLAGMPLAEALGWAAALLAMLTAYIRALGAGLGLPGCFHGPMAKPHRMALLTVACLAAAVLPAGAFWILWGALAAITLGAVVTSARRLGAIAAHLRAGRA
ncbi:MAG: CDP-alcohol phosphatidyltransferase family protein [Planctomycetes bacterium]|nr:CDP-alcohol phosphatidyltransferase family protein [Planctomycetota bacterium]